MKYVPDSIKKAINNELKEPQLAELASHFFQLAGGPRRVARMLFDEYIAAKPGSLLRQRIMDMILRTVKFANERSGGNKDLADMSTADVERELLGLMGEFKEDGEK